MQIQNINTTNFTGGYKFVRMPKSAREELPNVIKKGKTIYENFEGKPQNVFLITKDCYHDLVADFIRKHNLNCKYYSEVNPKMDFKIGHPEKVSEIIKNMTPVNFSFDNELLNRLDKNAKINKVNAQSPIYISNILKTLCIDADTTSQKTKNGVKIIKDSAKKYNVIISPPMKAGMHCVKIESLVSATGNETKRYLMTNDGTILKEYNTLDEMQQFNQMLSSTIIK